MTPLLGIALLSVWIVWSIAAAIYLIRHPGENRWWFWILGSPLLVFALVGGAAELVSMAASWLVWLGRRAVSRIRLLLRPANDGDFARYCTTVGDLRKLLAEVPDSTPLADSCGISGVYCEVDVDDAAAPNQTRISPFKDVW